jgi:hypothetical protein
VLWTWLACGTDGTRPPAGDDDDAPHSGIIPPTDPEPTVAAALTRVTHRLHDEFGTIVIASWTQDVAATVHVEFTVDGVARSSPERQLPAGAHEELLLGLPYSADTTFRVVARNAAGTSSSPDADARTGEPPAGLQAPVSVVSVAPDPAIPYVLASLPPIDGNLGSRWWTTIVDRRGRAVWARQSAPDRMTLHPRTTWGGDALLVDQNSYWPEFAGGLDGTVEELTLDGTVRHVFDTPGLHHPFTPLPDGALAFGSFEWPYQNESLVVVGRDGTSEVRFDCMAWLASIGETDEYCGSNTLNYDAPSDTFVMSFYSFDTIVQLDAPTGAPLAWFGHVAGTWAFDPPSSTFWWQHGAHLRADGALVTSTYDALPPSELVVRVYALDAPARTLRQLEVYGEGEGVFGEQLGEVSELPSGNVLHNYGTLPRLREFTPEGDVVWDVAWGGGDLGRTTPLADLYALAGPRP